MRWLRIVLTALLAPPLFFAVLTCATAAVASWLGRESLRFDVLAHFAPIWFAVGVVGLLASLILRGGDRVLFVGAGLVAVVAASGLILPELIRSTGPKAGKDAPGQIKVIQFNVWHHNRGYAAIVDWLAREDADIVILEETTPGLRTALAARQRWRIACPECEVMILARRAPVSTAPVRTVTKSQGPLTRATYRDDLGEFTVLGVHYAWPTDPDVQQLQEQRLAEVIGKFPRSRTIVAGDFNSAPWSFSRRRWDREFGLFRRDRALPTWPGRQANRFRWLGLFSFLPIDHVYAGDGWATVSVRRGPRLGSDHYPVVVTLAPRGPR